METPYLENLNDPRVRELMIDELDRDVAAGTLYDSRRLTVDEQSTASLLRSAFDGGTQDSLVRHLEPHMTTRGHSSRTAAETLGFGEFGRFYARAVCRRALERGQNGVEVYRARVPEVPRPDSQNKVGQILPATELLDELRRDPSEKKVFGICQPNSGLNVRLVRREVA